MQTPDAGAASFVSSLAYPATRRDDVHEVLHGVEIVDPYRWLESQGSPETRAWIDAQNQYTHAVLGAVPGREQIRDRLTAFRRYAIESTPFSEGSRYFVMKRAVKDDLFVLYVREGSKGRDEVLLDPHVLSSDHTTDIAHDSISHDGKVLVYGIRRGGGDETELRVMDVGTKRDFPDRFPLALYRGVSLTPDGRGFYYALQNRETGVRIRFHAIGTSPDADPEVFGQGHGPSEWVGADVSDNGRHLLLSVSYGWAKNDLLLQDLPRKRPAVPIAQGIDANFGAQFAGDRLIVKTDFNAPNGRIVEIDPAHPTPDRWREIVPTSADAMQGFGLVGGRIVVQYLHDVATRLSMFSLEGSTLGDVALPGAGSVTGMSGRWDKDELFFTFQSYTQPRATFRVEFAAKRGGGAAVTPAETAWWRAEVPFTPDAYETHQVWFTSKDGTRVPMFVIHKKGIALDGDRPTLLYGYGGFALSMLPVFGAIAPAWLERGGVYAVPALRGGSEFGEAWHRAGMLEKKQNVFDDFIAAAEWLIASRYTNPARLAIRGGSNGGLLVGAALTQRPELFRVALCEFPDLDMIGYYRFKNNNPPALLEYGDASKPEQFKFLSAYSPYQRVTAGVRYPAVLFTTGDEDTRVPPFQAWKMAARMQAASASGLPVLLLNEAKAGHAGGQPLTKTIENETLAFAFLAAQLGLR